MKYFGGYNRFDLSDHERTVIQAQADAVREAVNPTSTGSDWCGNDANVRAAIAEPKKAYRQACVDATNYIKSQLPKTKEQAVDHINAINASGTYPDYIVSDKVRNAYMWLIRHLMAGKNHDAHLNYDLAVKYYVEATTVVEKRVYTEETVNASVRLGLLGGDPRFYRRS